jgi:hypothetical protein
LTTSSSDLGDEDLGLGRLVDVRRRGLVDRALLGGLVRTGLVGRLAHHVHDAAHGFVADRNGDRLAGIDHLLAAHEAFSRVHGDRAHGVLAEMLSDLENQAVALVRRLDGVEDRRQVTVELNVDDGARDLANATNFTCHFRLQQMSFRRPSA